MSAWAGNPCRLCLCEDSKNTIPDDPNYLNDIFDASGVEISSADELPHNICNKCSSFINESRIFRKKCQGTQNTLLDMINKGTKYLSIKNENLIKYQPILPNSDDIKAILDVQTIENINMQEVYNIDNFLDENTMNEFDKLSMKHEYFNSDNEDLNTDTKGKGKVKNQNSNRFISDKEIISISLRKHSKIHKVNGKLVKKGSKVRNKQPLAECDKCGKRMLKKHLLAHFLIHDGASEKLICKHCGKSFDRPFGLLRHCRAKHGYERVDKCSYCDFMGCTEYEVRVHERLHIGDDTLTCEICGKCFKWKNVWLQHMAEHGDPNILCSECPEIFRSTRQLARHRSQKHKPLSNTLRKFQCPHCSHMALHKSTIQVHMKKKHAANNVQDITKVYKNQSTEDFAKNNPKNHRKVIKTDKIKTKSIKITNKEAKNDSKVNFISAFHKHLVADKTWQVDNSDSSLSKVKIEEISNTLPNAVEKAFDLQVDSKIDYLDAVGEGINAERDITDSKKDLSKDNKNFKVEDFKTNIEDLQNNLNVDLKMDEELNTDHEVKGDNVIVKVNPTKAVVENTIKCEICKKTMLQRYYPRHKRTHEPNYQPPPVRKRPCIKCSVCGTIVQEHNLKEHLNVHAGLGKRIACEHCDAVYNRVSRLLRHYKASHGYEKTDQCSYCEFRGCSRADVTLHERKHTGVRPYSCQYCGVTFRFSSSRQRHMAEKHGEARVMQCEECALTFLTPRLLSSHKYDKHRPREFSYQCALCHKVYKRRGGARRHLLKHHNEDKTFDKIVKLKLVS